MALACARGDSRRGACLSGFRKRGAFGSRPLRGAWLLALRRARAGSGPMRRLIATAQVLSVTDDVGKGGCTVPFDETPAPISMSGSSTTMPVSMGLPPVPPYSAVSIHLRSASVRTEMGTMLMPVL